MCETPVILYFGNDWFTENRTSSHHVALWLSRRFRVFYIECPGLRRPRGSSRDLRKIARKLLGALRGTREVTPMLKVTTIPQLPFHRFPPAVWWNRLCVRLAVRWLMWRRSIRQPIAWYTIPHAYHTLGKLGERLSVYYCTDDFASFPDVDRESVRRMDQAMTRKAGIVFAVSEPLLDLKRGENPNLVLSPHGVDVKHFAQALDPANPVPADIARLPGPIVGFYGLIERWVDLDLIDFLAERRPSWTFLMIGRVAVPASEVPVAANLHFIGNRPYQQLPAYGKAFTAAIIPYRMGESIYNCNPIKLREYLAMGKPVVSVSTPEIEKYSDVIAIARTPEDFLQRLDEAVAHANDPHLVKQRCARVAQESWDTRIELVWRRVEERLRESDGSAMRPAA